ncbi:hypothetical protein EAO75_30540, partial [Streptomyces sp. uw30]
VYVQYACKQPVSMQPYMAKWRAPFIGLQWLFRTRPTLDRTRCRADHVAYRSPCCAIRTDGGRTCPLDRNLAVSTS